MFFVTHPSGGGCRKRRSRPFFTGGKLKKKSPGILKGTVHQDFDDKLILRKCSYIKLPPAGLQSFQTFGQAIERFGTVDLRFSSSCYHFQLMNKELFEICQDPKACPCCSILKQ